MSLYSDDSSSSKETKTTFLDDPRKNLWKFFKIGCLIVVFLWVCEFCYGFFRGLLH